MGSRNRAKLIPVLQIGTVWEPQPSQDCWLKSLFWEVDDESESHLLPISASFSHLHQEKEILSQLSLGIYLVPCTVLITGDRALTGQTQCLPPWRTINSLLGPAKMSNSETQSKEVHPKLSPLSHTFHPVPCWSENPRTTILERTMS